jgi:nucleoside-diphosphate-sugar epimerase
MICLVTGSSGGIGQILVPELIEFGWKVIGFDLNPPKKFYRSSMFEFIQGDITNPADLDKLDWEQITHVVHLAAISSLPECEEDPTKAFEVNFLGTVSLIERSFKSPIARFVNASSSAVYENCPDGIFLENTVSNPTLIYPQTKLYAEKYCSSVRLIRGYPVVSLRFFNVLGPNQDFKRTSPPLLNYIVRELLNNRAPRLHSDGNQSRDYVSAKKITEAVRLSLITNLNENEIFNICSGATLSVNQIYKMVQSALNSNISASYAESKNLWDAYPKLRESKFPMSMSFVAKETEKRSLGSYERFEKWTGWQPDNDLEVTIAQTVKKIVVHIEEWS